MTVITTAITRPITTTTTIIIVVVLLAGIDIGIWTAVRLVWPCDTSCSRSTFTFSLRSRSISTTSTSSCPAVSLSYRCWHSCCNPATVNASTSVTITQWSLRTFLVLFVLSILLLRPHDVCQQAFINCRGQCISRKKMSFKVYLSKLLLQCARCIPSLEKSWWRLPASLSDNTAVSVCRWAC